MMLENDYAKLQAEGTQLFEKKRYARAEVAFAEALKLIEKKVNESGSDEDREKLAQSLNNLATVFQIQGKYTMALEYYLQSAEIYKELKGENSLAYATSLHNLAIIYGAKGEYERAKDFFERAFVIKKELLGNDAEELEVITKNLHILARKQGKLTE